MRRTVFEINEIPKELRQYFEEVEVVCGAPWKRVVEKKPGKAKECPKTQAAHKARGGSGKPVGTVGKSGGSRIDPVILTIGWLPTCACEALEPVPATVLDPFAGVGTVGLVAAKMGREAILCEIKPEYCAMSQARLKEELGMMVEVTLS